MGTLLTALVALLRWSWLRGVLAGVGLALAEVILLGGLLRWVARGRRHRWWLGVLLALKSVGLVAATAFLMGVPGVQPVGFALGASSFVAAALLVSLRQLRAPGGQECGAPQGA